MTRKVYIFVCGIANLPENGAGWTDNAVRWTETNTPHAADSYEYLTTFITRFLMQWWRARQLTVKIHGWMDNGFAPVLVGHSNGCDLILRVIRNGIVKGCDVHLISGACESDFIRNGLNAAMSDGRVSRVTCYWGGADVAMRFARLSRMALQWVGLGFGTLGLDGPKNVSGANVGRVARYREPEFGHSTWFDAKWFDCTMRLVTHPVKTHTQLQVQ